MKKQVLGGALALAVVLASGAAVSSNQISAVVRVVAFNVFTQQLVGQPAEGGPIVFVHTPSTSHVPSIISPGQHPPDPCFNLAQQWNFWVQDSAEDHFDHTVQFESILVLMAPFACNASVVAQEPAVSGAPAPILTIAPIIQ